MALLCGKNVALMLFFCISCVLLSSSIYGTDAQNQMPVMRRFGSNSGKISFLYCYSCGYRKAFEEYANVISEKYPEIIVTGANYEPTGLNLYLSKLIFAVKIGLIITIVSSFDFFGTIGWATPSWWRTLLDNKIYACMMIFFVGNMIEAHLVSSGAFEITLNGMPIWSKLETGRVPAPQELFQIIDSHMSLTEKIPENPDFVK